MTLLETPARPSGIATSQRLLPAALALLFFGVFCSVVLSKPLQLAEPDDVSYRGTLYAMQEYGSIALTADQYDALSQKLALQDGGGSGADQGLGGPGVFGPSGIAQWVELPDGRWISEKNPGYGPLAYPFFAVGLIRLAPLFYGGLACLAMFAAARRWLGDWAGTWAVGAYLATGAAMAFAWRAYMPTFIDASLVAAGGALVIWATLARQRAAWLRAGIGLLGFISLEWAVAARYTNIVFLAVACLAVLLARKQIGWGPLLVWGASVGGMGASLLAFNAHYYGSATSTGYASGLITFSAGSIIPNLTKMPLPLLVAMPTLVLAGAAVVVAAVAHRGRARGTDGTTGSDLAILLALGAGWLGLWGLYLAYDWTANGPGGGPGGGPGEMPGYPGLGDPGLGSLPLPGGPGDPGISSAGRAGMDGVGGSVHTIRFYVPALGMISMMAAYILAKMPRWIPAAVIAGLFGFGLMSFGTLTAQGPRGRVG